MPERYEAVVVGMGFGGAILRLPAQQTLAQRRVGAGARHPAVAAPQKPPGRRRFGDELTATTFAGKDLL